MRENTDQKKSKYEHFSCSVACTLKEQWQKHSETEILCFKYGPRKNLMDASNQDTLSDWNKTSQYAKCKQFLRTCEPKMDLLHKNKYLPVYET